MFRQLQELINNKITVYKNVKATNSHTHTHTHTHTQTHTKKKKKKKKKIIEGGGVSLKNK